MGNERLRKQSISDIRSGVTGLSGTSTQEFDDLGEGCVRVKHTRGELSKTKGKELTNHSAKIGAEPPKSPDHRPWDDKPIGKIAIGIVTGVLLALALILINRYML